MCQFLDLVLGSVDINLWTLIVHFLELNFGEEEVGVEVDVSPLLEVAE